MSQLLEQVGYIITLVYQFPYMRNGHEKKCLVTASPPCKITGGMCQFPRVATSLPSNQFAYQGYS